MKKTSLPQFIPAALAAFVFLTGCSSTYRFQVEAVKSVEMPATAQSFRVVSANPELEESDLRFLEAAGYVKTALSSRGLYEAPANLEADIVVEIDFGLEGPFQEMRTYYVPATATNSPSGSRGMSHALMGRGRDSSLHESATQEIPEVPVTVLVTVYDKFLRVSAREVAPSEGDRPQRELWSVLVSNRDESHDLRKYVPLLVTAAMDHMDQDMPEPKKIALKEQDARVAFVKRGL